MYSAMQHAINRLTVSKEKRLELLEEVFEEVFEDCRPWGTYQSRF